MMLLSSPIQAKRRRFFAYAITQSRDCVPFSKTVPSFLFIYWWWLYPVELRVFDFPWRVGTKAPFAFKYDLNFVEGSFACDLFPLPPLQIVDLLRTTAHRQGSNPEIRRLLSYVMAQLDRMWVTTVLNYLCALTYLCRLAPFLMSTVLNVFLYGIMVIQTHLYFTWYKRYDPAI